MTAIALVFFVFVAGIVPAFAQQATEQGRPDPTGRGRYLQFGAEVPYRGATVVKKLPAGAKCAPAGELVGVPLWNTTRAGHAILSRLTAKAQVAVSGTRTFLCECVDGYNELFVPAKPREDSPAPVAPPIIPDTLNLNVRIDGEVRHWFDVSGAIELSHGGELGLKPMLPPTCPPDYEGAPPFCEKKGNKWTSKKAIGGYILTACGIGIAAGHGKNWACGIKIGGDKGGPGFRTGPAR